MAKKQKIQERELSAAATLAAEFGFKAAERGENLQMMLLKLTAVAGKPPVDKLPNTNCIKMFFHCAKCLEELPDGQAPKDWARLAVGMTAEGMQIWCERHDINIAHIHFQGETHPCNRTAREKVATDAKPRRLH